MRYTDAEIAAAALDTRQNISRNALTPYRATVTDVTSGLVSIQRGGDSTDEDAGYPVIVPGVPAPDEEIVALDLGGAPVILGRLGLGGAPTVTATAAAGTTATTAGQTAGNDRNGVIELVPGGTGITTGQQVTITFAEERSSTDYTVQLTALTTAARTAGTAVGPTGRSSTGWALTSDISLSSGSTYRWSYRIEGY